MEPIEMALAKQGIERVLKVAEQFLVKIAGPAAEETGLLLQDKVRVFRFRNQVRMLAKAQRILHDAGISPISVPLRTLFPLLEGAALEEEDDLSDKWAALLANAATPDPSVTIYPSLPHILSQLSPRDARVLDGIYELVLQEGLGPGRWMEGGATRDSIIKVMKMSPPEFDLVTDNLIRLGIYSRQGSSMDFGTGKHKDLVFQLKNKGTIMITQLGYEFVTACRYSPPEKPL